jgi:hypothetical protein
MSKSNDISNIATLDDHRPLADSELNAVGGGTLAIGSQNTGIGAGRVTFNPFSITRKVDDTTFP